MPGRLESGGPSGDGVAFTDYINDNPTGLLDYYDFGGLVRDIGRGALAAIGVGFTMIVLAVYDAITAVIDAVRTALLAVLETVGLAPTILQQPAIAATAAEVEQLGAAGLPVGATAVLAGFGAIAVVLGLIWGFR